MLKKKSQCKIQRARTALAGWLYLMLLLLTAILFSCNSNNVDGKIQVFVASSLSQSLEETAQSLDLSNIQINAASSGVLARQIEAGAPCQMYFSANKKWVDYLEEKGLIESDNVKAITQNKLVFIAAKNALETNDTSCWTNKIINADHIAIGNPNHVPAGIYAMQVLKHLKIDTMLSDRLLEAKDVVSALRFVEIGEAEYGFVYKTDALRSDKVTVLAEIPQEYYDEIIYYAASMSDDAALLLNNTDFNLKLNEILTAKGFN